MAEGLKEGIAQKNNGLGLAVLHDRWAKERTDRIADGTDGSVLVRIAENEYDKER